MTDFQIFGRTLTRQDMNEWTGCKQRVYGDIVNLDSKDWVFNKTDNIREVEYLDFENDICFARDYSMSVTFQKALQLF